jgi:hypothetical protein
MYKLLLLLRWLVCFEPERYIFELQLLTLYSFHFMHTLDSTHIWFFFFTEQRKNGKTKKTNFRMKKTNKRKKKIYNIDWLMYNFNIIQNIYQQEQQQNFILNKNNSNNKSLNLNWKQNSRKKSNSFTNKEWIIRKHKIVFYGYSRLTTTTKLLTSRRSKRWWFWWSEWKNIVNDEFNFSF